MRRSKDGSATLTPRQLEVLELVARGHSNREIAPLLRISENGVKAHIARLLLKFGVPNRAALVRAALPERGETDGSVPDLYSLLHDTLSEVIGGTATEVLLHRALLRASSHDPELAALARKSTESGAPLQWWSDGRRGMRYLRAVLRELWRLLIEITGPVVVARLERRGLAPDSVPRSGGRT